MSIATIPSANDAAFVEAFAKVYREHYQLVYRTAYSVTGCRQDAEDVLQSVFTNVLERENDHKLIKSPRAYLYRSAVNAALNLVRSRNRRVFVDAVEELQAPDRVVDPMRRLIVNAIAKLKPRAVEILILRYEHGFNEAEIAKILGKSRGTIAVTLYRARARLKKLIRATGEKR